MSSSSGDANKEITSSRATYHTRSLLDEREVDAAVRDNDIQRRENRSLKRRLKYSEWEIMKQKSRKLELKEKLRKERALVEEATALLKQCSKNSDSARNGQKVAGLTMKDKMVEALRRVLSVESDTMAISVVVHCPSIHAVCDPSSWLINFLQHRIESPKSLWARLIPVSMSIKVNKSEDNHTCAFSVLLKQRSLREHIESEGFEAGVAQGIGTTATVVCTNLFHNSRDTEIDIECLD